MKMKIPAILIVVIVVLTIAAMFRLEIYRYCLSMELCKYPSLTGVEIRMRPRWIPETYDANDTTLLSFTEDGRPIAAGGRVAKFQIDPAVAKAIAPSLNVRAFPWGQARVGTLPALGSAESRSTSVHYLVVPELSVVAIGTDEKAFDDIVQLRGVSH